MNTANKVVTQETHYVDIDNKKIAYRKFGEGAPLVLLNRFRGTLDTWDPLFLQLLANSHTVITFDYPGVGYSEGELPLSLKEVATEVIKLTEHLNEGPCDILGWSYGGVVAQVIAFMYPEKIKKAVLVGTNPVGKNEVPFEAAFMQTAPKPTYNLEDYTVLFFEPKSEKSRALAKASMERYWPEVDQSKVPTQLDDLKRYSAGLASAVVDEDEFRGKYASTSKEMLVLSGDHDVSFALENWYPILKNAPTLQLITFPQAGHGPHYQYPELSVSYINDFLNH